MSLRVDVVAVAVAAWFAQGRGRSQHLLLSLSLLLSLGAPTFTTNVAFVRGIVNQLIATDTSVQRVGGQNLRLVLQT